MKEQIMAVQRMQDYIGEHLEQEITLSQLAGASFFSPWYSYRLFREYLGFTPAEYIRRLRLSHSAMRLKKEKCPVTDAAYGCGFGSLDGYIRAFFKEFGCNPGEYVKDPAPISLFIPYGVKFRELRKDIVDMENLQSIFVQVIRKPERKVIMKRGINAEDYFDYCEEVGCDIWGTLMSMDSLCGEPVCLWLPKEYQKPNTSTYVQGVEVEPDYRERKILKRFRVTPISPVMLLGVEFVIYVLYSLLSMLILIPAAMLFWGVTFHGNLLAFLGSWFLTVVSILSIGMMVGGIAKNAKIAGVIASLLYFPMLIFSGTTLRLNVSSGSSISDDIR